jgi:hypothetical protein
MGLQACANRLLLASQRIHNTHTCTYTYKPSRPDVHRFEEFPENNRTCTAYTWTWTLNTSSLTHTHTHTHTWVGVVRMVVDIGGAGSPAATATAVD